jgi:RNA polymerase sigma-70 factor, ECF subfamily
VPPRTTDTFLAQKLRQVVAALPEKPRMVMILRYQEDMGPDEIAEMLSMPVATVKSHLRRTLALLREKVSRSIGEVTI